MRRDKEEGSHHLSLDEKDSKKRDESYPLVTVRYLDHTIFKNVSLERVRCFTQKAVGWIYGDEPEFILLLTDFPINSELDPESDPCAGLVILKRCILEIKVIDSKQNNLRSHSDIGYLHQTMAE